MDTTHPDNSSFEEDRNKWRKALADQPYDDYKFVGVDILDESVEEQEASVTFVAKLKHKKTKERADFQEKSFFQLDADTGWLYLGGDVMNAPLVDLKTGADRTDEQDALIGGD